MFSQKVLGQVAIKLSHFREQSIVMKGVKEVFVRTTCSEFALVVKRRYAKFDQITKVNNR